MAGGGGVLGLGGVLSARTPRNHPGSDWAAAVVRTGGGEVLCVVRMWLVMVPRFFVCWGGAVLGHGGVLRARPPSTPGSARRQRRCGGEVLRVWRDGALTRRSIVVFLCWGWVLVGLGVFLSAATPPPAPRHRLSGGNVGGGGVARLYCCCGCLLFAVLSSSGGGCLWPGRR